MDVLMIGVLILAGGRGQRMGGQDKGWCEYRQKPMIEWVLQDLNAQRAKLHQSGQDTVCVISANRNNARYAALVDAVVSDINPGYLGPLSGIEAALQWGALQLNLGISRWITCPVDSMALPTDYLQRMSALHERTLGFAQYLSNDLQKPEKPQSPQSYFAHMSLPSHSLNALQMYTAQNREQNHALKTASSVLNTAHSSGSIYQWLRQEKAQPIVFNDKQKFLNINELEGFGKGIYSA
ncbi:NTP transferase domain-containing protein [Thiomicrorhabdus aquaedulcis]|uniref:NTP transferase domain-containing protein n=1 Tax=Thiomicrorhabdus aquaedulcis TaxID=2211106 RepID=UPI000FD94E7F|nr:NTP transferase domain-containing protein [Thiomicrorhabdus aquaedulcis]